MRFELETNEVREESDPSWQKIMVGVGILAGLDVLYYAFISNSIGVHLEHVTRTRMAVGFIVKWIILSSILSIQSSTSVTNSAAFGAVVGVVAYGTLNAFTQAVMPEMANIAYVVTNTAYGVVSTGVAAVGMHCL